MSAYLKLFVLAMLVALSGCSSPPAPFEGQWRETRRERWEGATDSSYTAYVEEFERLGPRTFAFEGDKLTVTRSTDHIEQYSFKCTGEEESIAFDGDQTQPCEVIHRFGGGEINLSKVYVLMISPERMRILWPSEVTLLAETPTIEGKRQIIEEIQEPISLVKQAQ